MHSPHRLLLIQLPRLDPDATTPGENVPLAAAFLQSALKRSKEGARWACPPAPEALNTAGNATCLRLLEALRPDVIGATLYLWNIERTLRLLDAFKKRHPDSRIIVGGPEVARQNPLLERAPCVEVAVLGEGEAVFPGILTALRRGGETGWSNVAWRKKGRLVWGTQPPPMRPLVDLLPPARHPIWRPDANGMAYLETSRGCPLRCAFCCYNMRRKGHSVLPPQEVERRIRLLRRRGTREIRLVDPTFNAHPRFHATLEAMRRANPDRRIRFFVELRADTLAEEDAAALAEANVVEAEVGVQSTDPDVLRSIHRPARLGQIEEGIERLLRHGIKPTIDFMYGLPHQGMKDIERSLAFLDRFPKAHPQFLPTLLLPGTELRDRQKELHLKAQSLPPYRVLSTDQFSAQQLAAIEDLATQRLGAFDSPTRQFVGSRLPDLFPEQLRAPAFIGKQIPGQASRRAIIFKGANLFEQRSALISCIKRMVLGEPDILWQFVLAPEFEEPLDLLEVLIATLRRLPSHWLDRLVSPPGRRRLAARRIFIQLPRRPAFDPRWRAAAETLLAGGFH